jgi:hypothetical protein
MLNAATFGFGKMVTVEIEFVAGLAAQALAPVQSQL